MQTEPRWTYWGTWFPQLLYSPMITNQSQPISHHWKYNFSRKIPFSLHQMWSFLTDFAVVRDRLWEIVKLSPTRHDMYRDFKRPKAEQNPHAIHSAWDTSYLESFAGIAYHFYTADSILPHPSLWDVQCILHPCVIKEIFLCGSWLLLQVTITTGLSDWVNMFFYELQSNQPFGPPVLSG